MMPPPVPDQGKDLSYLHRALCQSFMVESTVVGWLLYFATFLRSCYAVLRVYAIEDRWGALADFWDPVNRG